MTSLREWKLPYYAAGSSKTETDIRIFSAEARYHPTPLECARQSTMASHGLTMAIMDAPNRGFPLGAGTHCCPERQRSLQHNDRYSIVSLNPAVRVRTAVRHRALPKSKDWPARGDSWPEMGRTSLGCASISDTSTLGTDFGRALRCDTAVVRSGRQSRSCEQQAPSHGSTTDDGNFIAPIAQDDEESRNSE